jgi:class 3 adenylate cyclase/DNA-binding NarL/FixJ family response regulator
MADGQGRITVFLADDNVIVREGVRALLGLEHDLDVVGTADDYDSLLAGAEAAAPQVLVTDIRMPPAFQQEGIDAAKELRKRHPGTGVVVLSQYDDPDYAIALLGEGAAGYAYLLKDRVAEGDQLARAVREVATGGSMIDPKIVEALVAPVTDDAGLTAADERLLNDLANGRPIKAIAAADNTTAAHVAEAVDRLFLKLSEGATAGTTGALKRLRMLHQAIVDREEQGEQLSRLLPGGVAEMLRSEGRRIGETEQLTVTVLMGDIRGYSAITEHSDPSKLALQLSEHRAEMNHAILDEGGTVMQFVGDAVMACFGAPVPVADHADRAVRAGVSMIRRQQALNDRWRRDGRPPFGIGIGISTGDVAAALLGSDERMEYTVIGDTVNLAQRLQDLARPAGRIVLNESTQRCLHHPLQAVALEETTVKGRQAPVHAYRIDVSVDGDGVPDAAQER